MLITEVKIHFDRIIYGMINQYNSYCERPVEISVPAKSLLQILLLSLVQIQVLKCHEIKVKSTHYTVHLN